MNNCLAEVLKLIFFVNLLFFFKKGSLFLTIHYLFIYYLYFILGVFLARYNKGANAERELIKLFSSFDFAVLRVAGSGTNPLPCPDVVVLKDGLIIAVECKAKKGKYLPISCLQIEEELSWSKMAGAKFVVAWKVPRKGWVFLDIASFRQKDKNFMITLEEAFEKQIPFEKLILGKF
jgi:Holliday junction resolvase